MGGHWVKNAHQTVRNDRSEQRGVRAGKNPKKKQKNQNQKTKKEG